MWSLAKLPFELPEAPIPEFLSLPSIAEYFRSAFPNLAEEHFVDKAVWRDIFALTGTLRTFYTSQSVSVAWQETSSVHSPTNFVVDGKPRIVRAGPTAWVEISFQFETQGVPATTGYGYMSVVPGQDGKWRIWILRTILEQLKGQPDVDFLEPTNETPTTSGVPNGAVSNGIHAEHPSENSEAIVLNGNPGSQQNHFECVIVGGGQAGLSVGGRLKALGISYVVLEKNENIGDNWALRYDSTKCKLLPRFFTKFGRSPN